MIDKSQIIPLQRQGLGYRRIAAILNISENTVKSFVQRHPLQVETVCLNCGVSVLCLPHKKKRKFCSDKCRMHWWNSHKDQVQHKTLYSFICPQCGLAFTSTMCKNRIYCSRACFAAARRKDGGAHD